MGYETYSASDHKRWADAGLKEFGDGIGEIQYINQEPDYGDCLSGAWWTDDAENLTIYYGYFGNYNSPGADGYTHADVYDDAEEFAARVKELENEPEYLDSGSSWQVVIGNIGTVYEGTDEQEARDIYDGYVEQSISGHGRAAGEEVTLFCDDEIEEEHTAETQGMDD